MSDPTPHAQKISQLDGLRAIAILVVMVGHTIGYARLGPLSALSEIASLGVDLFFVLSGFLITGILLRSKGSPRYYVNFFGRRGLRIWPLYYLFLLGLYIFGVVIAVPDWSFSGFHFRWYALYAQALRYPVSIGPDPISVSWSLAIEEQFYLIWPFLIAALSKRGMRRIAWAIVLVTPILRFVYLRLGASPYIAFPCRADALALGSLIAFLPPNSPAEKAKMHRYGWIGFVLSSVVLAAVVATPLRKILAHSLTSTAFASALLVVLYGTHLARALSWTPLRYIGNISYCLYLVHLPAVMVLRHYVHNRIALCGVAFGVSIGVAELSRRFFEGPILSLKDVWFGSHPKPKPSTVVASAVAE